MSTIAVHNHDRAGQRVGKLPVDTRGASCRCGLCGTRWEALIDRRAREWALECPKCGRAAGVEVST